MEKKLALLSFNLLILVLPGIALAEINCDVVSRGSCTGSVLMEMSAEYNAHAALPGQGASTYYELCCSGHGIQAGTSGEFDQDILKLSSSSNAHVCAGCTCSPYTSNIADFSIDDTTITDFQCEYLSGGCDSTHTECIVTLSDDANAHAAECGHANAYPNAVCCSLALDESPPEITDNYGTKSGEWMGEVQTIGLEATDDAAIDKIGYAWAYEDCSQTGCDNIPDSCVTECSPLNGQGEPVATCDVSVSQNKNDNLCYFADDSAGIRSQWGSTEVKVDINSPITSCVNCPENNQVVGQPFVITLEANDNTAGVDKESGPDESFFCFYRDGGSCNFHEYTGPETIGSGPECPATSTSCEYTVKYYSTDIVGNQESPRQRRITYDKSYPTCEFSSSLPDTLGTRTVYLEWTASDPIPGSVFVSYEITAKRSQDGGFTYTDTVGSHTETNEGTTTYDFDLNEDGHYRFECVVTYNRNTIPASSSPGLYEVLVDTMVPEVQFTGPALDYSNQETFSVGWTVDDINNIDHYVIEVNGSVFEGNIPGSQTSIEYTGEHGKSYEMSLTAYDNSNNPSAPAVKTVIVDTNPPTCTMGSLEPYINKTTFNITWSGNDDFSGVASYGVCIKNDASECTQPTQGWGESDLHSNTYREFTGAHGNTYHFRCRATDKAGNVGDWSSPENTTIDINAPILADSTPYYPETMISTDYADMEINATAADDFGINNVSLVIGGTEIGPADKTGTVGDTEWTLRWEVPYDSYAAETEFSIILSDINGNEDTQVFTYVVYECNPGESRECNPEDPVTKEVYTHGICMHTGNRTCGADGMWGNCTGGTFPTDELCNDLDDDCDGEVDDGLDDQPCGPLDKVTTGKSICRLGQRSCVGGTWGACEGAVYPANEELCDGEWDDDCDGTVDNGCECTTEGDTRPCGDSNVGICNIGYQICQSGHWGSCQGAVYPQTEVCDDGLDNDCDSYTDCDDSDCDGSSACGEPEPPPTPQEFPWWILSVIGFAILIVLAILILRFRSQGEELTWETLRNKWSY